jgi:hypothetical protein
MSHNLRVATVAVMLALDPREIGSALQTDALFSLIDLVCEHHVTPCGRSARQSLTSLRPILVEKPRRTNQSHAMARSPLLAELGR